MAEKNNLPKSFFQLVETSDKPVLVDFWAAWCGPCKMLTPILEDLAKDLDGKVVVGKVDVDDAQSIAVKYDVTSVPTLILFQDGQVKARAVGVKDLQTLKAFVEEV